ncbi:hypothetical protein Bca52824_066378 [Brassica carinata]|nr:hypothetical protein Bca52824_066378 [Brassica carinata]
MIESEIVFLSKVLIIGLFVIYDQRVLVESVKATSDINSPVSGKVVEVNEVLSESPGLVNRSPYEDGWIIKVELSDAGELQTENERDHSEAKGHSFNNIPDGNKLRYEPIHLLSIELKMLEGKAKVEDTDMPVKMQMKALNIASQSLDLFDVSDCQPIAAHIKKEFDERYGSGWQCVVGSNFGCFFTHSKGTFIYFHLGTLNFLIFKGATL